ncbi:plasmid protein [Pectobacterium brasiliense]|uniref:plasmid protein n=1 Tax=Pectobacterium brasiliense TaxID=180957 RepID=UPI00406D2C79
MDDIAEMTKEHALARIIILNSFQRMIRPSSKLEQGQFVVTGPNFQGDDMHVGYCVQVRKGVGQFGSDIVFLRHSSGSLVAHENQCYGAMNAEQEGLARSVFEVLPEDEEYELGYSDCDKVHEIGFVIEHSNSLGTPDVPFVIAIKKHND